LLSGHLWFDISAGTRTIRTAFCPAFPQVSYEIAVTVLPILSQTRFIPNPSLFIIYVNTLSFDDTVQSELFTASLNKQRINKNMVITISYLSTHYVL
jgi:hypothetical protein